MGLRYIDEKKTYKSLYLSTYPFLMENGILIKPLLEKADNFLQLALDFVVVILEPLSGVIGVVKFDLEDVCALANPERVDDAELVAYIVDELVLGLTRTIVVQGFVVRVSGCRIATGPLCSSYRVDRRLEVK
jgi:hypothetical protein